MLFYWLRNHERKQEVYIMSENKKCTMGNKIDSCTAYRIGTFIDTVKFESDPKFFLIAKVRNECFHWMEIHQLNKSSKIIRRIIHFPRSLMSGSMLQ